MRFTANNIIYLTIAITFFLCSVITIVIVIQEKQICFDSIFTSILLFLCINIFTVFSLVNIKIK